MPVRSAKCDIEHVVFLPDRFTGIPFMQTRKTLKPVVCLSVQLCQSEAH